ncbi:MAG: 30S ribosomal protein S1, partial [Eubacteriales bacterium]
EVNRESRKVILSRKAILEEEYRAKRTDLWTEIEEGQVRKGKVRRLTNFGAFVDLGGIDGLLHVSEMAWFRVGHPSEILKENDEIEVFVLSVDKKSEKVSLSLKKILPSPWQDIEAKYGVGRIVSGKIVRLAPFGAFVELEPGVDALIHISQFSDRKISNPSEVVNVGDEITAKIVDLDLEKHKISMSVKQLKKDDEQAESTAELERLQKQQEETDTPTLGESLTEQTQKELAKVGQETGPAKDDEKTDLVKVNNHTELVEVKGQAQPAESGEDEILAAAEVTEE